MNNITQARVGRMVLCTFGLFLGYLSLFLVFRSLLIIGALVFKADVKSDKDW